jgi:transposase-like protein
MGKTRSAYPAEFRRQMVEPVPAGRSREGLSGEFEPTAQSIRNWAAQSARDSGRGDGGLTRAEREELNRLRRERIASSGLSGRFSQSRPPGSLERRTRSQRRVPVRERSPGRLSDRQHVSAAGCLLQWLLNAWSSKPGAVVSASPGGIGGFGPNHYLRQSVVFLNVPAMAQPEAYIGGADKLFDASVKMVNDGTQQFLKDFMQSYQAWITANIKS